MGNVSAAESPFDRQTLNSNAKIPISDKMQILRADDRHEAHMKGAGPGWYYDPEDEAVYRFWDGSCWTTHRSDLPVEPPVVV